MKYCLIFIWMLLTSYYTHAQMERGIVRGGVLVLAIDDTSSIAGKDLGTVQFKDYVFSSNCSYNEVVERLIADALDKGGNLLKITRHRPPDLWSTCHRIRARVYKVTDTRVYEHEINWSAERRLASEDFKGEPDKDEPSQTAALTYCGLTMETNRITFFKKPKFYVNCVFHCHKSWIRKELLSNKEILAHEQTHFDLNEVYARKIRQSLRNAKIESGNFHKANTICRFFFDECNKRQEVYDIETEHGTNKVQQQKWNILVGKELAELSKYSS